MAVRRVRGVCAPSEAGPRPSPAPSETRNRPSGPSGRPKHRPRQIGPVRGPSEARPKPHSGRPRPVRSPVRPRPRPVRRPIFRVRRCLGRPSGRTRRPVGAPTRMPKMILVFHASLAPRGYGRTSPRPSRVFLPFVANLARVVTRPGLKRRRGIPKIGGYHTGLTKIGGSL